MRAIPLRICLLLLLAVGAGAGARAQADGNPENWCRNGLFTDEVGELRLARVAAQGAERVHFWGDDGKCPDGPAPLCRLKSYLVGGDEVIVSRRRGGFFCAWYQPRRGSETVGWLPADRLSVAEAPAEPPLAAWVGEWAYYDNSVSIRPGKGAGQLAVEGVALWKGVVPGSVNVGEINSTVRPAAGRLVIEDDICRVRMRLVGPHLVVDDNGECGGVNVSFDGVYRRKPERPGRRRPAR